MSAQDVNTLLTDSYLCGKIGAGSDEQEGNGTMTSSEYMTVGEARALLAVSRAKMAKLIAAGVLHAEPDPLDKRVRFIKREEVERLAAQSLTRQRGPKSLAVA